MYEYVTSQKVCSMKFNKTFVLRILKEKKMEKLFLIFMNVSSKI